MKTTKTIILMVFCAVGISSCAIISDNLELDCNENRNSVENFECNCNSNGE